MTIKEALQSVAQVPGLPESSVEKALIDQGLIGTDTYTKDDAVGIDLAAIVLLQGLIYNSISEGDFKITIDKDLLKERLNALLAKNGTPLIVERPYITAPAVW